MIQSNSNAQEQLDIINDNDEAVGRAAKQEIFAKSLPHRIVHILIFNRKGEMLLQKRSGSCRFCPGFWSTSAAGHVQSGESYEAAAKRELKEELGLTAELHPAFKDRYPWNQSWMSLVTFTLISEGPFTIDPEEVELARFFSMAAVKRMIEQNEKIHPELSYLVKKHYF